MERSVRKARAKKFGRNSAPSDDYLVAMLSLADVKGDTYAARQFNVSKRTVQRYRARIASGERRDLAARVSKAKAEALSRADDLLTQVWQKVLYRLSDLLPDAGIKETLEAARTIGELRLTREALGVDIDESAGDADESSSATEEGRGTAPDEGAEDCEDLN